MSRTSPGPTAIEVSAGPVDPVPMLVMVPVPEEHAAGSMIDPLVRNTGSLRTKGDHRWGRKERVFLETPGINPFDAVVVDGTHAGAETRLRRPAGPLVDGPGPDAEPHRCAHGRDARWPDRASATEDCSGEWS